MEVIKKTSDSSLEGSRRVSQKDEVLVYRLSEDEPTEANDEESKKG